MNNNGEQGEHSSEHRNILVSIILSESTSSLLNLNLQNIEEISEVHNSTCVIRPVPLTFLNQQQTSLFSYIFGSGKENENKESDEISTEVAFFSDHYNPESDSATNFSDLEVEVEEWIPDVESINEDEIPPLPRNLCVAQVYMKPLLNANIVAHEDNINMEHNDIIVNLFNQEDNQSFISTELMCRICHGGESVGDLLKPCRCRGTIAFVHMECLEHWLRESANSYCELCYHHYKIVREPRYGLFWSVLAYMTTPGENLRDVILDLLSFIFYTPSAIATTYMLMVICENMAKAHLNRTRTFSAHLVAFFAVFGMAAIDFTYSSWLIITFQRHAISWRAWYRNNSYLRLVLPDHRKRAYHAIKKQLPSSSANSSNNPDNPNTSRKKNVGSVSAS